MSDGTTPRPWEYDGAGINGPWDGKTMPEVVSQEPGRAYESYGPLVLSGANAALIVRAVNAHEDLLDALHEMWAAHQRGGVHRDDECTNCTKARAAISKAGAP